MEVISLCRKCFKRIRQEKEISRIASDSDNRQTERTPRKCFRCGCEDHLIAKFPKTKKENEKRRKQVCFNDKGNRACGNNKNDSNQEIYASMARMSGNDKCISGNFCESSQFINWVLDSGPTCLMTPEVSYFFQVC